MPTENSFCALSGRVIQFIDLRELIRLCAKRKSALYADIKAGLLTKQVRVGGRSVAWPLHEIQTLNAARLAGKSDDEIKQIVEALHISRSHAGMI